MGIEHSNFARKSDTFSSYLRYIDNLDAGRQEEGGKACQPVIDA
jgi:hypothetical protein